MNVNFPRLLPVTAAVALMLAACGSESPTADSIDLPATTVADGGLRAPTPIRAAGGGSVTAGAGEDAAVASDAMIAPQYWITEFVIGDGLPALPDNTTGYVFDAGSMPSADDAARIAAALGVSGEPVLVDDGYSVSYRVGPDDGSAPSIVIWDDAMLSWNYNGSWGNDVRYGCAVAESVGVAESEPAPADAEPVLEPVGDEPPPEETVVLDPDIDRPVDDCVEPEPPAGVPTSAEAESRVNDLLAALDVDVSSVRFDTWADDWSAGVNVSEMIDGVTARSWTFGFGGEGVLQYAFGSTATPEPVGPYPLVDLDTAVARLNDGRYGWGWGGGPGIAVMSDDVAVGAATDAVVSNETEIAEAPPEDLSLPEPPPEPETVTVTLVDVQPDLWWVWDVDGSAWLVPAYRFIGDDDGWYTVPAVTDEYLVQVEPVVEPGVPEPAPVPVDPEPLPAPDMYLPGVDDPALENWLGLSLVEFEAAVTDFGWGPVRVAMADGQGFDLTADLVVGRVNVAVETDAGGTQYVIAARVEADSSDDPAPEPIAEAAIVEVYDGVQFYPACGDEVLRHESGTWYQVHESDYPDLYAKAVDGYRENPAERVKIDGFARVAPPGPGDDTGTLVVWDDGVARFVSDSGELSAWLVDVELEYRWTC